MIWRHPYFRKPPYGGFISTKISRIAMFIGGTWWSTWSTAKFQKIIKPCWQTINNPPVRPQLHLASSGNLGSCSPSHTWAPIGHSIRRERRCQVAKYQGFLWDFGSKKTMEVARNLIHLIFVRLMACVQKDPKGLWETHVVKMFSKCYQCDAVQSKK